MQFCNQQPSCGLGGSAGLKMPIHAHFFRRAILTRKAGHTDLVFGVHCSLVGLCMQDYKPLPAAIMICATLVDPKFDFYVFAPVTCK